MQRQRDAKAPTVKVPDSEFDCKGGCGRRTANMSGTCLTCQKAAPKPNPLKHDFSDPYCATREHGQLCKNCGAGVDATNDCPMRVGWREEFERSIAKWTDAGYGWPDDEPQTPGPYAIHPVEPRTAQSRAILAGGVWSLRAPDARGRR